MICLHRRFGAALHFIARFWERGACGALKCALFAPSLSPPYVIQACRIVWILYIMVRSRAVLPADAL